MNEIMYRDQAFDLLDKAGLDQSAKMMLQAFGFFDAPASKGHHLAEPFGLMRHSINVTKWLVKLTEAGFVTWERQESPYRIGMLHDLVKCQCYEIDQSAPGITYRYRRTGYVGHGSASAMMAMAELGIDLTAVECACIVHHMGAFGLDERRLKEYDAALDRWPAQIIATHTADILAARVSEGGVFE